MKSGFIMSLAEVAQALDAERIGGHGETPATGVATDSRAEVAGAVFVALQGDRFDGHDYIAAVKAAGAVAATLDACRNATHSRQEACRFQEEDSCKEEWCKGICFC